MKTKIKKLLGIVLLFAISSGVIMAALWMLSSTVKHVITPKPKLVDLTNLSENITRLTTNPGPDENPVWSADGKRILFQTSTLSSNNPIENIDIWIIDTDGRNRKQLTNYSGYDTDPKWSHDGTKIAYKSGNLSNLDIWIMKIDGSDKKQLTTGALVYDFDWSPDVRKMAYVSEDTKAKEIWVMDADGSHKKLLLRLAYNPYSVGISIAWNPDGSKIALCYQMIGVVNSNIYVINVS